jgi:hypothetical protein
MNTFGVSPATYWLVGPQQACIATSLAMCPTAGGPGSPGINGVESCILTISWQQNWPFRNYNLIQKIKNFQNLFQDLEQYVEDVERVFIQYV